MPNSRAQRALVHTLGSAVGGGILALMLAPVWRRVHPSIILAGILSTSVIAWLFAYLSKKQREFSEGPSPRMIVPALSGTLAGIAIGTAAVLVLSEIDFVGRGIIVRIVPGAVGGAVSAYLVAVQRGPSDE